MYIPILSRRKGGGGGKASSSGSSSRGSGGSSSSTSSRSSYSGRSSGISVSGLSRSATPYSFGGGSVSTISFGLFQGRSVGGGTRRDIYGTRTYGSGYPGVNGRGVSGRGFPFYYWPLAWGYNNENDGYLHVDEFGAPDNTSRPGGPMYTMSLTSSSNTTFRVIADKSTTECVAKDIQSNCSCTASSPSPFNISSSPKPEEVIQYYRASSVALTVDGYNNTVVFSLNETEPDVPLPSWVDGGFLRCVNETIGAAVPLVDDATVANESARLGASSSHIVGMVALGIYLLRVII